MKARVFWQSCVVAAAGCLASGASLAQSAIDCSSVAEDMARLKCYDEQAARQKQAASKATTTAPVTSAAPATVVPSAAKAAGPAPAAVDAPAKAAGPAPAAVNASAKAAAPAPAASASTPAAASSSAPPASSDFGLNPEAVRRKQAATHSETPKEPEQLVARVKAVATKARGEYRITLEDGQVWEETQHSSSTIPPEVGETVTIKRGMLGSYFLAHGAGLALRVKRVD